MSESDSKPHQHFYGGQAVMEGVMMRGARNWAVAVRRPDGSIYMERHPVSDLPQRKPIWAKPMLRGMWGLVDALTIGTRALTISANAAVDDEEQLSKGEMGGSLVIALVAFIGIFIVLPNAGLAALEDRLGGGESLTFHLVEGVVRLVIFLGYLLLISLLSDIRRVFMYHGAEHKTIMAWEHAEDLEESAIRPYSTKHPRCGTNFLLIVMLLAIVIYTTAGILFPAPDGANFLAFLSYQVALRVVLLPIVAGLAYEVLRLGADQEHPVFRFLAKPGLWLQKITTKEPEDGMVEVAVRAFEAVVPTADLEGRTVALPSPVEWGPDEATEALGLPKDSMPKASAAEGTASDEPDPRVDDHMIDDAMRARLEDLVATHAELEHDMTQPEVLNDQERYTTTAKRHAELTEVVNAYDEYNRLLGDAGAADELAELSTNAEAAQFIDEAKSLRAKASGMVERLKVLLLPKDPLDDKNVILEIRAGAGGDEAGLFAGEIERMYVRYAEGRRWSVNRLSVSENGVGGIKEVTFEVNGKGAYSVLKHESGVHRVQRVPKTESQGRIHTSTASVAVMPEAEDVDVQVNDNDLKIDVYRASGPGGQSVNTTDSAVRITHEPTGLVVSMQDEKSQLQNKEKALRVLKARLLQAEKDRLAAERADARASQIGTGDRSEKIRTYNFPQSRVTDHRIGFNSSDLDGILDGKLDEVLDALQRQEQSQKLAALATE